jgi:hypothetical protein
VQVLGARVSGANFSVRGAAGLMLSEGQSGELEVSFHPTHGGTEEETLELASTAGSPIRITLYGEAENKSERPITLHWDPNEQSNQGYYVYRGTALQGPFEKLNSVPVATPEFTDETSSAGRQYFYVVTTVNESGDEGPFTEPVVAQAP